MKNLNFPLLLGIIIVIFLLLVVSYPELFTSKDPLFEETPKYIEYKEDGEWVEKFAFNPMRPNKENIFGTDDAGRDVYARLVYGARNTLKIALLTAVFRMILASILGVAAGIGVKFISSIIRIFNIYFTAIPILLFSFVILNIGYFKTLEMDTAIFAFAIVFTIVGWAKPAGMIEDSTRKVMEEDFIEGEIAIGKTKLQIAYQNVLPHIIPTGISLFFKEMAMALFLIAQLAVLYVFVGLTRKIQELAFKADYHMILEPEWGGILSRIAIDVKRYHRVYWLTLYPILVFSVAIIGINLTGEGLRIEFQKRNSRVISSIRKAYHMVSFKRFIHQIKDIKKYYKPVVIKILIIILIIGYFIIPWHPSRYEFNIEHAKLHIEELTKDKYAGRVAGTQGGYLAGEYIINTLKGYGYEVDTMEFPLHNDEAAIPEFLTPIMIESGWIKLTNENGEEKTYHIHKDFTIPTLNERVFIDTPETELHYKGIASDAQNTVNIPEGTNFFLINRSHIVQSMKQLNYDIQFILSEGYPRNTNTYLFNVTSIIPFDDLRRELETGYKEVEIKFDYPELPKYEGRNITAFLPGKNRTKEEPGELIIIGASYDGVHTIGAESPYVMTSTPSATLLEVARTFSLIDEPLEKSIKFIFWDNDTAALGSSALNGSYYYGLIEGMPIKMAMSHKYYYFDISYPGFNTDKSLNFVTFPAQGVENRSYLIRLNIQKRLKQMNVKYRTFHYDYPATRALNHMRLNALTSVGLGNTFNLQINTINDTIENINYERMKSIGQIIIDIITMNSHIMD